MLSALAQNAEQLAAVTAAAVTAAVSASLGGSTRPVYDALRPAMSASLGGSPRPVDMDTPSTPVAVAPPSTPGAIAPPSAPVAIAPPPAPVPERGTGPGTPCPRPWSTPTRPAEDTPSKGAFVTYDGNDDGKLHAPELKIMLRGMGFVADDNYLKKVRHGPNVDRATVVQPIGISARC